MTEEKKEDQKENEIKLIKCKNCLKDIEEAKFMLHEGFCLRNNTLCEICKEPVLKNDLESHMEQHKKEKEEKEKAKEKEKERAKKLIEDEIYLIESQKKHKIYNILRNYLHYFLLFFLLFYPTYHLIFVKHQNKIHFFHLFFHEF